MPPFLDRHFFSQYLFSNVSKPPFCLSVFFWLRLRVRVFFFLRNDDSLFSWTVKLDLSPLYLFLLRFFSLLCKLERSLASAFFWHYPQTFLSSSSMQGNGPFLLDPLHFLACRYTDPSSFFPDDRPSFSCRWLRPLFPEVYVIPFFLSPNFIFFPFDPWWSPRQRFAPFSVNLSHFGSFNFCPFFIGIGWPFCTPLWLKQEFFFSWFWLPLSPLVCPLISPPGHWNDQGTSLIPFFLSSSTRL